MEVEGNPLGMEIGGGIRKKYEDAFESLKQTNSYIKGLELIASMSEVLGKSRPDRGRGAYWARDMIEAYRNLGNIIKQMSQSDLSMGEDWEYLENLGRLLKEYGEGTEEELEEALKVRNLLYDYKIKKDEIELIIELIPKLPDINKVLKKYGIGDADELEESLGNKGNLEDELEELQNSFG